MKNLVELVEYLNVVRVGNGDSIVELNKVTYDELFHIVNTTKNVCINLLGEIENECYLLVKRGAKNVCISESLNNVCISE